MCLEWQLSFILSSELEAIFRCMFISISLAGTPVIAIFFYFHSCSEFRSACDVSFSLLVFLSMAYSCFSTDCQTNHFQWLSAFFAYRFTPQAKWMHIIKRMWRFIFLLRSHRMKTKTVDFLSFLQHNIAWRDNPSHGNTHTDTGLW